MKLEIELSEEEVKEMKGLAESLAKKIIGVRAGIYAFTLIDRLAGKVFDAYNRAEKEKQ